MNKLLRDGIGYYLSCMIPFNIIYFFMTLKAGMFKSLMTLLKCKNFNAIRSHIALKISINYFTALIIFILIILGVVATVQILKKDDSVKNAHAIGKTVKAINVEDLTSENYFANFSLIVLTGISIPAWDGFYSLIIYIAVLIMLGIVYIKKRIIYMNPILTLQNYSIYRCKNKNKENGESRTYIFVIKNGELKEGQEITYENIPDDIIRLNNKIN